MLFDLFVFRLTKALAQAIEDGVTVDLNLIVALREYGMDSQWVIL